MTLVSEIDDSRWLDLAKDKFGDALADFDARVADGPAVRKMLRAAAKRVTERAPALLATVEGFVAFAVDWELEGDSIATILKQCGATPGKIREWKKRGWL